MHQRRPLQPPHAPIAPLRLLNEPRITNTEVGGGTRTIFASSGTVSDASVALRVRRVHDVPFLASAGIGGSALRVETRVPAMGLANCTRFIQSPSRFATTDTRTRTTPVLASTRTLSHSGVLNHFEPRFAGAFVGADARAAATAAFAVVFAFVGVAAQGEAGTKCHKVSIMVAQNQ